jgi:hypothetical protein
MLMRCYFNLTNGIEIMRDDEGIEVICLNEALNHARRAVEELREEDPLSSCGWHGWRLEMVDGSGRVLRSLPLDEPPGELSFQH